MQWRISMFENRDHRSCLATRKHVPRRSPRSKSYRDPELPTGNVVVPSRAIAREGVAHLYGGVVDEAGIAHSDPDLNAIGRAALESRGIPTADSLHLTWSSIFAQSRAMVEEWREAGYRSVDMEARHPLRRSKTLRLRRHRPTGGVGSTHRRP